MTYEQYWNQDCTLVKYYREAHKLKTQRDNEFAWLQGMYIYEALCDVSPIFRDTAKKGTKPIEYSSRPYAITKEEIDNRQITKEKQAYEQTKAKIESFRNVFNKRFGKEVSNE